MMTQAYFLKIAEYGNENWKASFTKDELKQNAEDYFYEFKESNEQGKATSSMEELCKLLIEDVKGGSEEAKEFLLDILAESEWYFEEFECEHCGKKEIAFFSKQEFDNLIKHHERKMLITDAIPEKPNWIREVYISGLCKCEECWKKYFNGELF